MNVQLDPLQLEAQSSEQLIEQMEQTFAGQQRYFAKNSNPTITQRMQDLALLRTLLGKYKLSLSEASNTAGADQSRFGAQSRQCDVSCWIIAISAQSP